MHEGPLSCEWVLTRTRRQFRYSTSCEYSLLDSRVRAEACPTHGFRGRTAALGHPLTSHSYTATFSPSKLALPRHSHRADRHRFPTSVFVKRLQFNRVIPIITVSTCLVPQSPLLSIPFLPLLQLTNPSAQFCWGLVCMCNGFVQNFAGLCVCRLILGFFEGCLFPAMTLFWVSMNRLHLPEHSITRPQGQLVPPHRTRPTHLLYVRRPPPSLPKSDSANAAISAPHAPNPEQQSPS
jgi:hypothetical protein